MQHIYVEVRYTQKGELVATSTYNEYAPSGDIKSPKRVLYRGKSLGDLVAKINSVQQQLATLPDPVALNTREKGYQECSIPKLTRKISRIVGERKRLLAAGLTP